jgi:nucleoside-triphosphatase
MEKRHILICGERGMGKSTLIEKLLAHNTLPVYGYFTKLTPQREDGFHSIYIYRAGDPTRTQGEENHIGDCDSRQRSIHGAVFDTLGVEYLEAKRGGIIVMDEVGFMEAESKLFCAAVMRCLDGDIPALVAVKARFDVDFLNAVRAHPKASLYTITEENRDGLYQHLLPVILKWNKEGAAKA